MDQEELHKAHDFRALQRVWISNEWWERKLWYIRLKTRE